MNVIKSSFYSILLIIVFLSNLVLSQGWTQLNTSFDIPGIFTIESSWFFSKDTGFVAANTGFSQRYIFKTTDGCRSWHKVFDNPMHLNRPDIQFINDTGWISGNGDGLFPAGPGKLLKTTDRGKTWELIESPHFYTINFIDKLKGYGGGPRNLSRTTDGGRTWVKLNVLLNFISGIYFYNDIYGWAAGQGPITDAGSIYKTTDGGDTWQAMSNFMSGHGKEIVFTDSLNGFVAAYSSGFSDAVLQKTTNAGQTWDYVPFNVYGLFDIKFTSPDTAWFVGSKGLLCMSADSGNTWQKIETNTNADLYTIRFFENNKLAYVLGDSNTVLVYDNSIPVELTSFNAVYSKGKVNLWWETATETNNKGFVIERSADKTRWEKIGFIPGAGSTADIQKYNFTDINLQEGKLFYRLKQIDFDGRYEYSDITEVFFNLPAKFSLSQNYPNPFNPVTKIKYSIGSRTYTNLKVYDILGNEIATLVDEQKPAGEYEVEFNGSGLSSGIYFYTLISGSHTQTNKLVLLK